MRDADDAVADGASEAPALVVVEAVGELERPAAAEQIAEALPLHAAGDELQRREPRSARVGGGRGTSTPQGAVEGLPRQRIAQHPVRERGPLVEHEPEAG